MTEKMLQKISQWYALTEQDAQGFGKLKVNGMQFHIRTFQAEGLGHVSVMSASGFFGLMKMDTLIINPTQRDMPLLSYDRVYAMGNNTLIYELYDTMLENVEFAPIARVKQSVAHLPDHDLGQHWYDSIKLAVSLSKKGKKVHTAAFDGAAMEYLTAYLQCAETAEACAAEPKRVKASVYVEGLLEHGGPSTNVFKKGIGADKTADLFRNILFGTRN